MNSRRDFIKNSAMAIVAPGPLKIKVKLPSGIGGHHVRKLVAGGIVQATVASDWCQFEISTIPDHEVVVIH